MPTATLATLARAITTHADLFGREVAKDFAHRCPAALTLNRQAAAHEELATAVAWILRTTDSEHQPTPEAPHPTEPAEYVAAVVTQLGVEHRRSSTNPDHYALFAHSLEAGLRAVGTAALLPPDCPALEGGVAVLNQCCELMATAARDADQAGIPPFITGTVAQVERRCRRFTIIRVQADAPVNYPAGGALAVAGELDPGVWRTLCPSIPANEYGQLEFHVPTSPTPGADGFIVSPKPGDTWRIAAPYLPITVDTDKDLLLISHGVGLAPLRAITMETMLRAHPPRIHFFVGADYPGELYDLYALWEVAATAPFLSVTPVVKHEEDEWWVRPSEHATPPRGLHLTQVGTPGEVAASFGTWEDRNIIIAGLAEQVRATTEALVKGGTPEELIQAIVLDERLIPHAF